MKLLKTKSLCLMAIFSLCVVQTTHAADNFFWSDIEPTPSCSSNTRDGSKSSLTITDKNNVIHEFPTCEEATKKHVKVLVNGKYLHTTAGSGGGPFIEDGRTMIPLRAIADAFDFEVTWDQKESKIHLTKPGHRISMQIGSSEMVVNDDKFLISGATPLVQENVTFLPVRQLAEALGLKVEWNAKKRLAAFSQE
ncbi:hypothetical protein GCM10008014_45270 [Paenibacillus silvae]|uniref:Copper amine oxidase-like N-terminal domain-containing protein n=1 Tax=Paenibacillus silvae TaxID=1325358 RepID=A0ABQ1ZJQ3_9BACL|nr:copper amine oxidase N-terminal domain-containing protein [Paenibacillus silvae]GGH65665.1 hypothetical protein GCM10008014_45270 [Paenibacillus silvae]